MDITKNILNSLNGYVFNLAEGISEKHNVPIQEVLSIWCDQQNVSMDNSFGQLLKQHKKQKAKEVTVDDLANNFAELNVLEEDQGKEDVGGNDADNAEVNKASKSNPIPNGSPRTCAYVFTRGAKKNTRCQVVSKCGEFCSKHKLSATK
jgi:hypothetical protein